MSTPPPESPASAFDRLVHDSLMGPLSPKLRARVLGQLEPLQFQAGQTLYDAQDKADWLMLLDSGTVQLRSGSGLVISQTEGRVGDEAWNSAPRMTCATALTAVQGWRVPAAALQTLVREHPDLPSRALTELAQRLAGFDCGHPETPAVPRHTARSPRTASPRELVGWVMMIIGPAAVFAAGMELWNLSLQASIFSAILCGMVTLWVFELVDEFVPPVIAMLATAITGLAPASVTLGGFASPGLMSLLGIFALGAVLVSSGLSYRILLWLLTRLPNRHVFHHGSFLGMGFLLTLFLSSASSRHALMRPIWRDSLESLKLPAGSLGATSLYAAMTAGAVLMAPMVVTGKSSNMALVGLLPTDIQQEFVGLAWLGGAAAAAVLMVLAHALVCRWLLTGPTQAVPPQDALRAQLQAMGPLSGRERTAGLGLIFMMLALATATLHHVQPAWVAGCVLVAMLLTRALSRDDFTRRIDWPAIFMLLGSASIMRVMDHLELTAAMTQATGTLLGPLRSGLDGQPLLFVLLCLAVVLLLRLGLQASAAMITGSIVLLPMATISGVHPWVCIFLVALFSEIVLMRSQSFLLTLGHRDGDFTLVEESSYMRYFQAMNLARVGVGFASVPWWQSMGLL